LFTDRALGDDRGLRLDFHYCYQQRKYNIARLGQIDREVDRQIDREVDRQIDREVDRQIDREVDGGMGRRVER
jgi:hypothetical protein